MFGFESAGVFYDGLTQLFYIHFLFIGV